MNEALTPSTPEPQANLQALLTRLDTQDETIKELTGLTQELCATVVALKAFANSAALSHPKPDQLLSVFQDHMDYAADALTPEQIAIYRKDMQQIQNTLLLAVQRHTSLMP